jgi:hypothetical protein
MLAFVLADRGVIFFDTAACAAPVGTSGKMR